MMTFTPPREITATYCIVTPMFLGGADPRQVDSKIFRNASLKGALRFWWRALNWGRMLKEASQNKTKALKKLHEEEGRLFGKASDGKDSQQSQVHLSSRLHNAKLGSVGNPSLDSLGYLLGQGLYSFKEKNTRNYLSDGQLELTLTFKPGIQDSDIASVKQAAIALGIFGGLGSRSRKGIGSLSIKAIDDQDNFQKFTTREAITQFIDTLDFSAAADAPLSALTHATRVDISITGNDSLKVLEQVGSEQQLYRSYGRKFPNKDQHEVNGQKARQKFRSDHDNVLAASQGENLQNLPKRAVFGLPHNYFFSSTGKKVEINSENEGRRASPLFIHIHALENTEFIAIQTLLPGEFLPESMAIDIKPQQHRAQKLSGTSVDYAVIHCYLNGFKDKEVLRSGQ